MDSAKGWLLLMAAGLWLRGGVKAERNWPFPTKRPWSTNNSLRRDVPGGHCQKSRNLNLLPVRRCTGWTSAQYWRNLLSVNKKGFTAKKSYRNSLKRVPLFIYIPSKSSTNTIPITHSAFIRYWSQFPARISRDRLIAISSSAEYGNLSDWIKTYFRLLLSTWLHIFILQKKS